MSDLFPREILTFPAGEKVIFRKADFPWLVAVRLHLKGGDASIEDGVVVGNGYVIVELYDESWRPSAHR